MKIGIIVKFIVVVGIVTLIIGGGGIYFSALNQKNLITSLYFENAVSLANSIDAGISQKDLTDPEIIKPTLYKLLLLNPEVSEITIYKFDQGVFNKFVSTNGATDPDSSSVDQANNSKVISTASVVSHRVGSGDADVLHLYAPLHISGQVVGTYKISVSLSRLSASLTAQTIKLSIFVVITMMLLSMGTFLFVFFAITKPLNKLTGFVHTVEGGKFDAKVDIHSKDEIGSLARAFEEMGGRLGGFYKELEDKVAERTAEVSEKLKFIENQNQNLEDNKLAMLNLLEDAKQLEEDLEVEKASVEKKVVERTGELMDEKTKLSASIEALIRSYTMFDTKGDVILVNHKVSEFLGPVEGVWTLSKLQERLGESFNLVEAYKECLNTKLGSFTKGCSLGPKYFDMILAPVFRDKEKKDLIGVLFLMGDVTEELALTRSRDEFFSIASHELRTPLTAIKGNASMILEYYTSALKDPELKSMIDDIRESSERLISIVNDFLNMGRLEQGKLSFKPEDFDIYKLTQQAIAEYQVTGSRQKLSLEIIPPSTPIGTVYADPTRVREVLINLVGNAIKYTETGGVKVSMQAKDGFVNIFVADTGRGIPLENQGLLFRKFQQAGSSIYTRDTAKGTGLGLYISKLMVNGMGGRIWLEKSEVGKGSIFAFSLPQKSARG